MRRLVSPWLRLRPRQCAHTRDTAGSLLQSELLRTELQEEKERAAIAVDRSTTLERLNASLRQALQQVIAPRPRCQVVLQVFDPAHRGAACGEQPRAIAGGGGCSGEHERGWPLYLPRTFGWSPFPLPPPASTFFFLAWGFISIAQMMAQLRREQRDRMDAQEQLDALLSEIDERQPGAAAVCRICPPPILSLPG